MLQTEALAYSPQVMRDTHGPGKDGGVVYVRDGLTEGIVESLIRPLQFLPERNTAIPS